jgi:hypothetical protein
MAQNDEKAQLIAQLAQARSRLSESVGALRHDLDFSSRAKKSFKSSPLPWMGGAAILGLFIARVPRRPKKVVHITPKRKDKTVEKAGKAGLLLAVMKIVFDFVRPFLLRWATRKFTDSFGRPRPQPARVR